MSTASLLPQPPLAHQKAKRSTRTSALCPKEVRNGETYQYHFFFLSWDIKKKKLIYKKTVDDTDLKKILQVQNCLFSCPSQCMPLWGLCMRLCFRNASGYRTPGPAASFDRILLKLMTYVAPWLRYDWPSIIHSAVQFVLIAWNLIHSILIQRPDVAVCWYIKMCRIYVHHCVEV